MKRNIMVSKRINKRIQKLKDQGVEGKALRNGAYKAVMIEEGRGNEKRYMEATAEVKKYIRDMAQKSGAIGRFKKIQHSSQLYMLIQTKQQLVRIANRENMFELIFENLKKFEINQVFSCELIAGNRAWISQSEETKKYRYFTMQPGERPYSLSIFDLIEIVDGVSGFQYAAQELARLLDLDNLQDEWIETLRERYQSNINYLVHSESKMVKKYPTLYRYVKNQLELLKILNDYGRAHTNRLFMQRGEHIFYISTTELIKKKSLKMDQPAVSRAINLLALLKVIKKIPYEDLSEDLKLVAKGIKGNNKEFRYINFFIIPLYESKLLLEGEKMAKKLEAVGINNSRGVSKKNVMKLLGVEFYKSIYFSFPEGYNFITTIDILDEDEEDIPF